jgi:hypothetical protein
MMRGRERESITGVFFLGVKKNPAGRWVPKF